MFSESFTNDVSSDYTAKVVDMQDIEPEKAFGFSYHSNKDVNPSNVLVFIVSNYGEGQPTDNAKSFYEWLMSDNATNYFNNLKQNNGEGPLVTIFGLGNSKNFPERYQAVGKNMEKRLKELGCEFIFKRGEGDDSDAIETDFENWKEEFINFLKEQNSMKESITTSKNQQQEIKTNNLKYVFELLDYESVKNKIRENVREYDSNQSISGKNPIEFKISTFKDLTPKGDRRRLEILLDIENTPLVNYETGDHIGIFPRNPKQLIERLEKRLNTELPFDKIVFTIETPKDSLESVPFFSTKERPLTLYQVMNQFYDLNGVILPSVINFLADRAVDTKEKSELEKLGKGDDYNKFVKGNYLNVVDLLEQFPSIKISWQELITILPKITPRYYSISSSHLENEERKKKGENRILRITYSPLLTPTTLNKMFYGLCSNYLPLLQVGGVCSGFIRTSSFRLPEDNLKPIVMTAAGTGIAPFKAFIEHRKILRQRDPTIKFGKSILFYGVRDENDLMYKQEIDEALKEGLISDVFLAYSTSEKRFVSHLILEQKELIIEYLLKGNANLYLCGGVHGFGESVYNSIQEIYKEKYNSNTNFIDQLRKEQRCFEDLSD
ncbi:hypothetical protein ABK040_005414 [Willaertia magna]